MKLAWTSLLCLAISVTFSIACVPDDSTGAVVGAGYDEVDPHSYYEVLGGDLSLPFSGTLSPVVNSKADWDRLVEKLERSGVEGLPPDERRVALSAAVKAFLFSVADVRLHAEIPGTGASGTFFYIYEKDSSGFYVDVRVRHFLYAGLGGDWPGRPFASSNGESEKIVIRDPSGQVVRGWVLEDHTWTCQQENDDVSSRLTVQALHVAKLAAIVNATPGNGGSIGGRRAISVEVAIENGEPMRYWLDRQTLWPLKIEFLEFQGLPRASLVIEQINSGAVVTAPGDCETG